MAVGIGGGMSYTEQKDRARSQFESSQRAPQAMRLRPEYDRMLDDFMQQYGITSKYESNKRAADERRVLQAKRNLAGSKERLSDAIARGDRNATNKWQRVVNSNQATFDRFQAISDVYEPEYMKQAETTARGIREAADAIPEYMQEQTGIIPQAYQAASDKYGGVLDNIINQAMTGGSFQEQLPEGLAKQMLSGINLGFGGQSMGSFAPQGAAQAVSDLYGTRATERSRTMALLSQLAEEQRAASVVPSELEYEAGLTPLLQKLQYAEKYPENMGYLSAMTDLRGIFEPMLYTTTQLGGQFPTLDTESDSMYSSTYKSGGGQVSVGIGGGDSGGGGASGYTGAVQPQESGSTGGTTLSGRSGGTEYSIPQTQSYVGEGYSTPQGQYVPSSQRRYGFSTY